MMVIILFFTQLVMADAPIKWENAMSIVERHEFYGNSELITKPKDSWQVLFGLTFLDASFRVSKDCIYYRVPGDEPGRIKIRAVPSDVECSQEILASGDSETNEISDLMMTTQSDSVVLEFKRSGKKEKWEARMTKDWNRPEPKPLLSSADYKSPAIIALAPSPETRTRLIPLKDSVLCHDVGSDCMEKSASICGDCESGWHEVPNGCASGPKFCGNIKCGAKGMPACRRGSVWQRKEIPRDCRINSSFAWCSPGLSVNCEGDRAYCR